jgi:hypothetical protein
MIRKKHNTLLEKTNDFSSDLPIRPKQRICPTDEETIGGTDNRDGLRERDPFRQSNQFLEGVFTHQRESDQILEDFFGTQRVSASDVGRSTNCFKGIEKESKRIGSVVYQLSYNSELKLARVRGKAQFFSQTTCADARRLEQETVDTTVKTV